MRRPDYTTLEAVAVWADEIRGTAADEPHWHYDDMPVCGAAPPRERYCPGSECNSAQIERLTAVLRDPHEEPRARNEALVAEAGQGTPASWASESNSLARTAAYRYPGFACGSIPAGIVVLDRKYQREAETIVRQRVLLAGGRLANLLNETLVTH